MATRKGKYPQLADRDWLYAQYVTLGKSCPQIAAELGGATNGAVEYRLHQFGIPVRGRHYGHWNEKACERCGESYTPSGPAQRFCSPECREGTKKCEQCDKEFALRKSSESKSKKGSTYKRRFCSFECQQAWRAENCSYRYFNKATGYVTVVREPTMSRRINGQGYAEVNIGADNKNGGRVLEHIFVMEQRLGRRLLPHEEVHHKNGIKSDNDPGNLELWTTSQPRGQRVEDKIAWAVEFLGQYGYAVTEPIAAA